MGTVTLVFGAAIPSTVEAALGALDTLENERSVRNADTRNRDIIIYLVLLSKVILIFKKCYKYGISPGVQHLKEKDLAYFAKRKYP